MRCHHCGMFRPLHKMDCSQNGRRKYRVTLTEEELIYLHLLLTRDDEDPVVSTAEEIESEHEGDAFWVAWEKRNGDLRRKLETS